MKKLLFITAVLFAFILTTTVSAQDNTTQKKDVKTTKTVKTNVKKAATAKKMDCCQDKKESPNGTAKTETKKGGPKADCKMDCCKDKKEVKKEEAKAETKKGGPNVEKSCCDKK